MANAPVTLAVITGAHGVTGEVRLKLFTDDVASLKVHTQFNEGALTLKSVRAGSHGAIARFDEIADRTAAEQHRGTELTVARDALSPLGEGEVCSKWYTMQNLPCVPISTLMGNQIF